MTAAARSEIPQEVLRATWERVRNHRWPATFEEAQADPQLRRLLVINTKHPGPARQVHPWPFMAGPSHRPQPPANAERFKPAPVIDIKRLAAGDRDD